MKQIICPLCNGLQTIKVKCPRCNCYMVDEGPIVNYMDNYSPYLASSITQMVDGAKHNQCMHLFRCKKCKMDKRIAIDKITC